MTEEFSRKREPNPAFFRGLALLVAIFGLFVGNALGAGIMKRVTVPIGGPAVVLEGAMVRGDRDAYLIAAKAGALLEVSISSVEDNTCFQISESGSKTHLPGAGEGDDAQEWSGKLVKSGEYSIIVGGIRGNAAYKLTISLK